MFPPLCHGFKVAFCYYYRLDRLDKINNLQDIWAVVLCQCNTLASSSNFTKALLWRVPWVLSWKCSAAHKTFVTLSLDGRSTVFRRCSTPSAPQTNPLCYPLSPPVKPRSGLTEFFLPRMTCRCRVDKSIFSCYLQVIYTTTSGIEAVRAKLSLS